MELLNKKASAAIGIIIIIVIIIIIFWIAGSLMKECRKDTDCGSGYYCGSDFKCHEMKITEKTIIKSDFSKSAYIIGFAVIIGAVIIRFKPKKTRQINLKKFIEQNPPTNASYHSDDRQRFR